MAAKEQNGIQKTQTAGLNRKRQTKLDGVVLSQIIGLIKECGLRKNEISKLKIKDVLQGNNIVSQIVFKPGDLRIKLPQSARTALISYINHLQSTPGYDTALESPLFPGYFGSSGQKKLSRHLLKWKNTSYQDLHDEALENYFDTLIKGGSDYEKSISDTAKQFRMKERGVEYSISVKYHSSGSKKQVHDKSYMRPAELFDAIVVMNRVNIFVENKVASMLSEFFKIIDGWETWGERLTPEKKASLKKLFLASMIRKVVPQLMLYAVLESFKIKHNLNDTKMKNLILNFLSGYPTSGKNERIEAVAKKLLILVRKSKSFLNPKEFEKLQIEKKQRDEAEEKRKEAEAEEKMIKGSKPIHTVPPLKPIQYRWLSRRSNTVSFEKEIILGNMIDLIFQSGLFRHEAVSLKLRDVIRTDKVNDVFNNKDYVVNEDAIVSEIQPVKSLERIMKMVKNIKTGKNERTYYSTERDISTSYGEHYVPYPIKLSDAARAIIAQQIHYLKERKNQNFFSVQSYLFPSLNDSSKLCDHLGKYTKYKAYNGLRNAGILHFCKILIEKGLSTKDIVEKVYEFSRFKNKKTATSFITGARSMSPQKFQDLHDRLHKPFYIINE